MNKTSIEAAWIDKKDILSTLENKKLVFWGSGSWVEKTIEYLGCYPQYIIDNNENLQGHMQDSIKIISYEQYRILKENDEYFIVVTTGSYTSLEPFLRENGILAGKEYCCSPVLKNLKIKDDLTTLNKNLLITVPAFEKDGGGLYIYNTKSRQSSLVMRGKLRALAKSKNYIVVSDETGKVLLLDFEFKVLKTYELLNNSRPHGVAISEKLNQVFVANSGRDSVSIFDLDTARRIKDITISTKFDKTAEEQHHINDLWINEETESLYISMFSFTGNWKSNCYDGGVLEYDLSIDEFCGPVMSNMWMPHSIQFKHGEMYLLDSMRGDLYKGSNKIIGSFQGFLRGLDYDQKFYYIAQSAHRHFNRLQGLSLNIPLNCGLYIFDEESKVSIFHSLFEFENIHSVIALDDERG